MSVDLVIAKSAHQLLAIPSEMANRHGLIAGATGTGKTVTVRVLAEELSRAGVPVFMADVKGDLAGLSYLGSQTDKIADRLRSLCLTQWSPEAFPTVFWDVFGNLGHPFRTTVTELGPLLLSRLLALNDTQSGVLQIAFRAADDAGMLLLDLKDLRAMLTHVGENAKAFTLQYGTISSATVGAIQRALLTLQDQGGDTLFGEPAFDIHNLLRVDEQGKGIINILAADSLIHSPLMYSTLLLWLLSDLYERLPEVGDCPKPKLAFIFDEAHLLFNEAPKVLVEQVEQIVRLIRSKGVGIYFVSQSPLDIPDKILGQLGNRVQHALRSFTPKDQKVVKATAETFRSDSGADIAAALCQLEIGEAIVSFLDKHGAPQVAQRAKVFPPRSRIGAITPEERQTTIQSSPWWGIYEEHIDRESAYEILRARHNNSTDDHALQKQDKQATSTYQTPAGKKPGGRTKQNPFEALLLSAARSVGGQLGRAIFRGIFGSVRPSKRR